MENDLLEASNVDHMKAFRALEHDDFIVLLFLYAEASVALLTSFVSVQFPLLFDVEVLVPQSFSLHLLFFVNILMLPSQFMFCKIRVDNWLLIRFVTRNLRSAIIRIG